MTTDEKQKAGRSEPNAIGAVRLLQRSKYCSRAESACTSSLSKAIAVSRSPNARKTLSRTVCQRPVSGPGNGSIGQRIVLPETGLEHGFETGFPYSRARIYANWKYIFANRRRTQRTRAKRYVFAGRMVFNGSCYLLIESRRSRNVDNVHRRVPCAFVDEKKKIQRT